jgi:hypothetical protein
MLSIRRSRRVDGSHLKGRFVPLQGQNVPFIRDDLSRYDAARIRRVAVRIVLEEMGNGWLVVAQTANGRQIERFFSRRPVDGVERAYAALLNHRERRILIPAVTCRRLCYRERPQLP